MPTDIIARGLASSAIERLKVLESTGCDCIIQATVDQTSGTPTVNVVRDEKDPQNIITTFQFSGLKGKDGAQGTAGKDGVDGKDGYTPIKGVDYFDGEQGPKGDKGEKGDTGETGPQGPQGEPGKDASNNAEVISHLTNVNNPHSVTKEHIGLENVLNVASYSKAEVDALLQSLIDRITVLEEKVTALETPTT